MTFRLLIVLAVFMFAGSCYAQEPDWLFKLRKLKVFDSKKADVEREFDFPKTIDSSPTNDPELGTLYHEYETPDGKLEIRYSTGKCSEHKSLLGYDVSSGTVVEISFEPRKSVIAKTLNFDYDSFETERVDDLPGAYLYRNLKEGIWLSMRDEKVTNVEFSMPEKYRSLMCENVKK